VSVENLREYEHATFSNFQILYHQKSIQNNMQTIPIGLTFHQPSHMIHQLSGLGVVKRKIDWSEKKIAIWGKWI